MKQITHLFIRHILTMVALFASLITVNAQEWETVFNYSLSGGEANSEFEATDPYYTGMMEILYYEANLSENTDQTTSMTSTWGRGGTEDYFVVKQELTAGTYKMELKNKLTSEWGTTSDNQQIVMFYTQDLENSENWNLVSDEIVVNEEPSTNQSNEFTINEDGTYYLGFYNSSVGIVSYLQFADLKLFRMTESEPEQQTNTAIRIPAADGNHYQFRFTDEEMGEHTNGEWADSRTHDFTMSAWVKLNAVGNDIHVLGFGQKMFWGADGTFSVRVRDGKYVLRNRAYTKEPILTGDNIVSDNNSDDMLLSDVEANTEDWVFVTAIFDETNNYRALYINGQLQVEGPISEYGLTLIPDEAVLYVGNNDAALDLDEVQVWKRALSGEEVLNSMTSVDPEDEDLIYLYRFTSMNEDFTYDNLAGGDIKGSLVKGTTQWQGSPYWTDIYTASAIQPEQVAGHPEPQAPQYTVTVSPVENGTLTVMNGDTPLTEGENQVEQGSVLTLSAEPATGYELVSITVNGEPYSNDTLQVMADATIGATFAERIEYCVPTYTNDEGNDFEKYTETYVEKITLTNGEQSAEWNHSEREFYNVLDLTIDAVQGETVTAHFVGHSLGDYTESTVLQDLRFTAAVLAIDWNRDGDFEYVEKIAGNTPPTHNVGGNMDVLDITKEITVPYESTPGLARVRINYTNAWFGNNTAEDFVCTSKEGIVYDFDINVIKGTYVPPTYAVNWTEPENGTITVMNGDTAINSGDEVEENTELTISATPDEGYELTTLTVNGEPFTSGDTYTVTSETNIEAVFSKVIPEYTLMYQVMSGADYMTVRMYDADGEEYDNPATVKEGAEYTVEVTLSASDASVTIKVNDVNVDAVQDGNVFTYTGTVSDNTVVSIDLVTGLKATLSKAVYYDYQSKTLHVADAGRVAIYNIAGNKVMETTNQNTINVASLPEGIYLVTTGNKVLKFVK